jgi:hypothetical protein
LLAEAGRVARAVEVLLKRADVDASGCTHLIEELARQEQIELQRALGRIEPRARFKGHSPHPLRERRPRSILYVDESGQSHAKARAPHFFAVGAVAVPEEEVDNYCVAANEVKLQFFGRTDITFHEPAMRRHLGPYYFDGDRQRQRQFDQAVERLIVETDFMAFGVGIRKRAFQKEFVETGIDPYLPTDVYAVAIIMLLERYIDFLAFSPTKRLGRVSFESQGPKEDAYHQLEYARTFLDGSQWVPDSAFRNWLEPGLHFTVKQGSSPAELADMFARTLYEWIRRACRGNPKKWAVLSRKVYCRGDGMTGKSGVKVFPDSDIRERVEAHRRSYCGCS